ncbi:MAG TPA: ATP-binding protein, partial [Thermoanaerobaculia bacterium]|nr:ATP-binding protein [Thermoanaerobaculia bacterium]
PSLIAQIQKPPVERVGVMDIESFYPSKDRFGLAMALNNLLGSPGFAAWLQGDPLDVDKLLYTEAGKPRVAIFSIAHLSDRERMFFVSLLLNQTLGWMRSRTGTTSLRAILCMDEVFGYMPPVAEPPSKRAMLTLLKQARAFGLGLVLATQNPADLDYKGLANVGTWFLGRLQTERDKMRLMDGLEGAAAGGHFDRAHTEQVLAGLGNRIFLLHNVHEDEPVVFQCRWALSYLRGPLTRPEIKRLMDARKPGRLAAASLAVAPTGVPETATPSSPVPSQTPAAASAPAGDAAGLASVPPVLPPDVQQAFLPVRARPDGIVYQPCLFAQSTVHYVDARKGIEHAEDLSLLAALAGGEVDWYAAETIDVRKEDLETEPAGGARFAALPDPAVRAKSYAGWENDLEESLYRTRRCELFRSPTLEELSKPGESERDFRIRLTEKAREKRDDQVAELRKKYGAKVGQIEERLRRAEQAKEKQAEQARQQTWHTLVSTGTAVAAALFGRKLFSRTNLNKATSAVRGVGRAMEERGDVGRAEENVETLKAQLTELNAQMETEIDRLEERFDP